MAVVVTLHDSPSAEQLGLRTNKWGRRHRREDKPIRKWTYSKADHHLSGGIELHHCHTGSTLACRREKAPGTRHQNTKFITGQLSPRMFLFLVTFSRLIFSPPEKSSEAGQRTAGDSQACARQQRPPVFWVWITHKVCVSVCAHTKTPLTYITLCVYLSGSLSSFVWPI